MLEEHQGVFPRALAYRDPSQDAVYALPEAWHSLIYSDHILNMPNGHRFSVSDCYDTLRRNQVEMHDDEARRSTAVIDFVKQLQSRGLLTLHPDEAGDPSITVDCTFKDLPAPQESGQLAPHRQTKPRCKRCCQSMDPILADDGYHFGCD